MNSGKPQDQALAVAYAAKRKTAKKADHTGDEHSMDNCPMATGGECMYHGGLIEDSNTPHDEIGEIKDLSVERDDDKEDMRFAHGGSVADRIMARKAATPAEDSEYEKSLTDSGNEDEDESILKELYTDNDEEMDSEGGKGHKSLADRIMARRSKKQRQ